MWIFLFSGSRLHRGSPFGLAFQVILVQVKTAGNHSQFQNQRVQAPPAGAFVAMIPFERAKSAFGLDAPIHSQKGTVDAVEIGKNLCMELRELPV